MGGWQQGGVGGSFLGEREFAGVRRGVGGASSERESLQACGEEWEGLLGRLLPGMGLSPTQVQREPARRACARDCRIRIRGPGQPGSLVSDAPSTGHGALRGRGRGGADRIEDVKKVRHAIIRK
jgi:hypothetical protein